MLNRNFKPAFATGTMLFFVVVTQVFAGANQWTLQGPQGGVFQDIKPNSTDPNVFYAAYGQSFARSVDGGNSWQMYSFSDQVNRIAVDPDNGDIVYVAVLNGVYRSKNAGQTFQLIATASQAWSVGAGKNHVVYYATPQNFYRSVNGGDNFDPPVAVTATITDIVLDASNPSRIYAIRGPFLDRSADAGATWNETQIGASANNNFNYVRSIIKLPDGSIFAATDNGMYDSVDDGDHWTLINNLPSLRVAQDPNNAETLLAVGYNGEALWQSIDAGKNWAHIGTAPRGGQLAVLASKQDPKRLITASWKGIQISTDRGLTWSDAAPGPIAGGWFTVATTMAPNSPVYIVSNGDLYTSLNGSPFALLPPSPVSVLKDLGGNLIAVKPGDPRTILSAGYNGVYKSLDGGSSFANYGGGTISGLVIDQLQYDPKNTNVVYLMVEAGATKPAAALYQSTDGGASWSALSVDLPLTTRSGGLAIDPANTQRLFVAEILFGANTDMGQGLYYSSNGGINWTRSAFAGAQVYSVVIDPSNSQNVYAGTDSGFYFSTNAGVSFAKSSLFSSLTLSQAVNSIIVDPVVPSTLYVDTFDAISCCGNQAPGFLLRSVDAGQSWEVLRSSSDLPQYYFGQLLLDPSNLGRIYANTGWHGMATFDITNDLAISISNHSGTRTIGSPSSFDMQVQHLGSLAATGVKLTVNLPSAMGNVSSMVSPSNSGSCVASTGSLTCSFPVLRPSAIVNVHVNYTPQTAAQLSLVASLTAHEFDNVPQNNSAQASALVGEVVDLGVAVTSSSDTVDHGDAVNYVVQISNAGPAASSAEKLVFSASDGLVFGAAPSGCSLTGQDLACDLSPLNVGASSSLQIPMTANKAGTLVTTATVSVAVGAADINSANDTKQTSVTSRAVADASITITDSADPVIEGAAFSYSVSVRNDGPDDAQGVSAKIVVPGVIGPITAGQGTCSNSAGTINCVVGSIASLSAVTIDIRVNSASIGAYSATASVTTSSTDKKLTNNSALQTTTVNPAPPPASPPPPQNSGGGGSMDFVFLMIGWIFRLYLSRQHRRA